MPRPDSIERRVADYIAGMTDRYAIKIFENFYVPGPWAVLS
jgi:dGTPase